MTYPLPTPPQPRKRNGFGVLLLIVGVIGALCLSCALVNILGSDDDNTLPVVTTTSTGPRPARSTPPPAPAPALKAATPTPKPKPSPAPSYATLTARQWLKVAKDPDAHAGERYVVHGVVTQFDAATGRDAFRADIDGPRRSDRYDYETNTIVNVASADASDLVEGDEFTASVEVVGGYTYETAIGGQATAPELTAAKIRRRG